MRNAHVIFGPPGTGKTSRALAYVHEAIAAGMDPRRIGFVSFARRTVLEGKARLGLATIPPYFGTLHSIGYGAHELRRGQVIKPPHYADFCKSHGIAFTSGSYDPLHPSGALFEKMLWLVGRAAASLTTPEAAWREHGQRAGLSLHDFLKLAMQWERWKQQRGLQEFDDMLAPALAPLPLDLLVIDEAQDLSPAQWFFAESLASPSCRVILAGDTNQSIYGFAGSHPRHMLSFESTRENLPHSYRLPQKILAMSARVLKSITNGEQTPLTGRDAAGKIGVVRDVTMLNLRGISGSVLLLARSRRLAFALEEKAREAGVVYQKFNEAWSNGTDAATAVRTWLALREGVAVDRASYRRLRAVLSEVIWKVTAAPDSLPDPLGWDEAFPAALTGLRTRNWWEFLRISPDETMYLRALERHGTLTGDGNTRILSIHMSKGSEADHVFLRTSLPAPSAQALQKGGALANDERRVCYVGITRSKETLTLIGGNGPQYTL